MPTGRHIAAVIPIYNGVTTMLEDLLDSLDAYLGSPYHAIVIDDATTDDTAARLDTLARQRANLTALRNARNHGWGWGNYLNLARGAAWALEHLDFDVLLKLDHDSLIIGPGLAAKLRALFTDDRLGLTGSLQPEYNRYIWDWRLHPRVKRAAREHGYLDVMHGYPWSAQAGVLALRRELLAALLDAGQLTGRGVVRFGTGGLVEDALVGPLCYAHGFTAIDAPFILSTYGSDHLLRIPYRSMRDFGLTAIHPVKQGRSSRAEHNTTDHAEVRAYFQALRAAERDRLEPRGA